MTVSALLYTLALSAAAFEPNLGQSDPEFRFIARQPGFAMGFAADTTVLLTSAGALRTRLPGARPDAPPFLLEEQPARLNYLRDPDPACWVSEVPTFARAGFSEIWPGIDIVYYEHDRTFEFDFVLAPGADPEQLALTFDAVTPISVAADGGLRVAAAFGEMRQQRPIAWQEISGNRISVAAHWRTLDGCTAQIQLGEHHPGYPVIVDPTLTFSTWHGGSGFDQAWSVALDGDGFVYLAGETVSLDFPVQGGVQPVRGGNSDAFVSKFDPAGSSLVWSTYLGGNGDDIGYTISVDAQGRALIAGNSFSSTFPTTPGALQTMNRGLFDAFVTLLDASGSAMVFSTLLGGSRDDFGFVARWDGSGAIVVSGATASSDWPVLNPLKPALEGTTDGFVARLSGDGTQLLFSTWFGGSGSDEASFLTLDGAGRAVVLGTTDSVDLPILNAVQPAFAGGSRDLLVARIDPVAGSLLSSTYLGGSALERPQNLALDPLGNILIAGDSDSTDFPLASPFRSTPAALDAVLVKLSPDAGTLLYSTYLGGSASDSAFAFAGDSAGNLYACGRTASGDFPQVSPLQTGYGGGTSDAWVTRIDPSGQTLIWSSWAGGVGGEDFVDLKLDGAGSLWLAGRSNSNDFPTLNPVQPAHAGNIDAVLVRISEGACALPIAVPNSLLMARNAGNVFARWNNVAGATEYRLYEDIAPDWPAPTLLTTVSDGPTGTTRTLPTPAIAFWTVRAANACGEGPR